MSRVSDNYWDKIPEWDSSAPEKSFIITADEFSGRIPVTKIEDWHEFTNVLESDFLINLIYN